MVPSRRELAEWLRPSLMFAVYAATALFCIRVAQLPGSIATFWLPNAIAIGVALRCPFGRRLPALAMHPAALLATSLVVGRGWPGALGLTAANFIDVLIGVGVLWVLDRVAGQWTVTMRAAAVVIGAATLGPAASGFIAAAVLAARGFATFDDLWWTWFAGRALGAMLVLPVALSIDRASLAALAQPRRLARLIALMAGTAVFALLAEEYARYPFVLITVPVTLAAALMTPFKASLVGAAAILTIVFHGMAGPEPTDTLSSVLSVNMSIGLATVPPFLFAVLRQSLADSEHQLAATLAMFRTAMRDSAIGMAQVAPSGRLLDANHKLVDFLGYSREELVSVDFQSFTHPDDVEASVALAHRLLAGEIDQFEQEKRYVRKDGRAVWALLAVSIVRNTGTEAPAFFISQIVDIDARKRAEAALAESENRWSFALESAGQGVWDLDCATGSIYYSALWWRVLGYEPGELPPRRTLWLELMHPDDLGRATVLREDLLAGRTLEFDIVYRLRHKSGEWLWIADHGKVVASDADGRPLRIVGTHSDVTAKRQAGDALRLLTERMRLAVEIAELGIWEVDIPRDAVTWDRRMGEVHGVAPEAAPVRGRAWWRYVVPEDLVRVTEAVRRAVAEGSRFDCEFRIRRADGGIRHVRAFARVLTDAQGQPERVVGALVDTTEQHRLTRALFDEKERLRITLISIGDAVVTTDCAARITFLNPAAEKLTGWRLADAVGKAADEVLGFIDEASGARISALLQDSIRLGEVVRVPDGAVLVRRDGSLVSVRDSAAFLRGADGAIEGEVLVLQDVTRTRRLQRELAHSAMHDALTDLPNRRSFELSLAAACQDAGSSGSRYVVGYLDLDRFKLINDTAGHAAGDAALREVARIMSGSLRREDLLARLGGDEFGLILRGCDTVDAERICGNLIARIREIAFFWEGRSYTLGASVGITGVEGRRREPGEVLKEADVACYAAKSGGRNRVAAYRADVGEAALHRRHMVVAASLRDAIAGGRLLLYAQEVVSLQQGCLDPGRAVELLVRMRDNDGRIVEPSAFIPAAERYDLMGQIDRWVIGTVFERYSNLLRRTPNLIFGVNLSANALDDDTLWGYVSDLIASSGVAPWQVGFEITETAMMTNPPAATAFAAAAQAAGVRIALDDFGAGLSSFSYLKSFKVDAIKIDASFVRDAPTSERDVQIVKAIVGLAGALGIRTIAEGIETREMRDTVARLGVGFGQGYYWSRPRPLDDVLASPSIEAEAAVAEGTP